MKNLFSYGSVIKDNQLKAAEFWSEDKPGAFEDITNKYITERGKRVAKSKSVELQGKLHLDLAIQEKYLPIGLELAIDPPPPRGNFVHYDFLKLHYIRRKMKDVSSLRVAALTTNSVTPQNSIKRP